METKEASESMSNNPCCTHLKEKYSKLIASRNALREAVKILQQQIDIKEAENVNLQKEITRLKAEIVPLQQKHISNFNIEDDSVKTFEAKISKEEKEFTLLKVQLDKEKKKAGGKAEDYKCKLTSLGKDANEAKPKLVSERCTFQDIIRRLKFEKQELLREKKLAAESEMLKLQEQKKLSESYKKKANLFSKHLKEYTKHIEEGKKQLENEKQKVIRETRRADAERVRADNQKKLAEDNLKKAMEERDSVSQLSEQLRKEKWMVEDWKKKIHELSSGKLVHESGIPIDVDSKAKVTEVKLLKKQLRFEKMRVKHAKQKSKLEASCHGILQQELGRLKLDFTQFMERLNMLELSISTIGVNADDINKAKNNVDVKESNHKRDLSFLRTDQMHRKPEELVNACFSTVDACDSIMTSMQHTVPHLNLSAGNSTLLMSGTESKLKPLTGCSYRKIIQTRATKSSPSSFSDGKLMGSQDRGALSVLASEKLDELNFIHGAAVSHSSGEVTKSMSIDAAISGYINTSHFTSEGVNKGFKNRKRKRSPKTKLDKENGCGNNRMLEEDVVKVLKDGNACGNANLIEIGSTLETTPRLQGCTACLECEFDVKEIDDGYYMKLLDLDVDADEEIYQRATDELLSPTLPEVKCLVDDTVADKLIPLSDEILGEELCNYGAIDAEINSSILQVNTSSASNNVQPRNMPACPYSGVGGEYCSSQFSGSGLVTSNVPDSVNEGDAFPVESETKSFQDGIRKCFLMFPDTKDPSINSRIVVAAGNCIARCRLDTQTEWAAGSILLALGFEENDFPKEKVRVLLSLLLLNFSIVSDTKFGELSNGNIMSCSDSYAQHICSETGILFEGWSLLNELLCLIEDFLICGKVVVCDNLDFATLTELCQSGAFVPLSSKIASSEQIVGCSIILASICAAFDHIEFICEASCNVLLMCEWESSVLLMILHIFSHLAGEKLFNSRKYTLSITVLKSIVMFLEGERSSEASLCPEVNCSFCHNAASVDITTSVLLEKLSNIAVSTNSHQEKMDYIRSSKPNVLLCNDKTEEGTCIEEANCVMASDMPGCMKNCLFCATYTKDLQNISICQLADVLSLVELLAYRMRWEWTSARVVPKLLKILDSSLTDDIAFAVVTLLGQLGRLGVEASGFDSKGVMDLRLGLLAYLSRHTAENAYPPLRVAILLALLGLTSFDLETLTGGMELPTSLSADAEIIKEYFSQLTKDEKDLLGSNIFER